MNLFQGFMRLFTIGTILFLILPLAIVIPVSFTQSQFLLFPPEGFSFRWYKAVFSSNEWIKAIKNSLLIALGASLLSTSMGGVLAFVLKRYNIKFAQYIRGLGFLPIMLPEVTFGMALMTFFYFIGYAGRAINVIIAHSIFFLPFPLILISAGLEEVDKSLEEAALTLGATEARTFRTITLPIIRSNVFASILFAFVLSLNEYIVAYLCAGLTITTMPIKIFTSLRYALSPDIAVVSTLFIIVTVVMVIIVDRLVRGIWRSM
ncbi:MAG: ABC transporter permease [Candidatus Methanomethylicaceae archaeon]